MRRRKIQTAPTQSSHPGIKEVLWCAPPFVGGHSTMDITDVKVFPVDEEKLRAYVTITLDGCFVVRDLKVIHGTTGLFVAMPAKKRKDGTYKDIAHPLNAEMREKMERIVLAEYEKATKSGARPMKRSDAESYPDPD
jgi:stage V sporulation protein G